ncbi:Zinc finger MYM-type 5 [Sigmodon hispidus]
MAAHLTEVNSFGDPTRSLDNASKSSPVKGDGDDDDVVFVEFIKPPVCATAIAEERNSVFAPSKHENPQGNCSIIPPPLKDLTSKKGNICETIVIDDEGDTEINGGEETNPTNFTEWGPSGNKNSTKNLDFFGSSLPRSKTKTGVGTFNPGRMDVADALPNGRFAAHHNPVVLNSNVSLCVLLLIPWLFLVRFIFKIHGSPSQHPFLVTRNNKGWILYHQWPHSLNIIFSLQTNILLSLLKSLVQTAEIHYRRGRQLINEKDQLTSFVQPPAFLLSLTNALERHGMLHIKKILLSASLSSCEYYQNHRKEAFTKSRCIMCNKLGEVRHEISVNNVTHKLCSNNCFNEYRSTNGLIMNCCEQCGEYMPKNTGHKVLIIGQLKRFCCQHCASKYQENIKISLNLPCEGDYRPEERYALYTKYTSDVWVALETNGVLLLHIN